MKKFFYIIIFVFIFSPIFVYAQSLKTTSDKIIDFELYQNKEGEQLIKYDYKGKIIGEIKDEIISQRTVNSQTFKISQNTFKTKIFVGQSFIKEGDIWFERETATTTLKEWNLQYKSTLSLIKTVKADNYYVGDGGSGYCSMANQASWILAHDAVSAGSCGNTQTLYYISINYNGATSWFIYRVFTPVDTSALPDDAIITSAIFNFYPTRSLYNDNDDKAYISLVQTTELDPTSLDVADYSRWTTTEGTTPIRLENLSVNNYNSLTLNATGLGWISKTGWTKLALLEGHDINNEALTTQGNENAIDIRSSRYDGTNFDPYLEIIYSTGEEEQQEDNFATSTYMDYLTYHGIIGSSTVEAYIYIPFFNFFMVFLVFVFTILVCWFVYYLVYKNKR